MYYAIFDEQTKCYLATGYNFQSKEEVADAYVNYKSIDTDEKWLRTNIKKRGLDAILQEDEFVLEEREKPFEELDQWR